jgi:DNA replication protein DnaC
MTNNPPRCPLCGGTGFRLCERNGYSGAAPCRCLSDAIAAQHLRDAGIPAAYASATLETFRIDGDRDLGFALHQVAAYSREFPVPSRHQCGAGTPAGEPALKPAFSVPSVVPDPKPGLLLTGDSGTGKTHLAIGAMKKLLERGHQCVFFDFQKLLDRIRESYNRDSGTADREAYSTALDAQVLVLDDLGAHRSTDWVEDIVTSIITTRCNEAKPLIVTTNLEIDDSRPTSIFAPHRKLLADVIGPRSHSRLFEMCRIVRMPAAADFRRSALP